MAMGAEVKPRLGRGAEIGCAVSSRCARSRPQAGPVREDRHGATRELGRRASQSQVGLERE